MTDRRPRSVFESNAAQVGACWRPRRVSGTAAPPHRRSTAAAPDRRAARRSGPRRRDGDLEGRRGLVLGSRDAGDEGRRGGDRDGGGRGESSRCLAQRGLLTPSWKRKRLRHRPVSSAGRRHGPCCRGPATNAPTGFPTAVGRSNASPTAPAAPRSATSAAALAPAEVPGRGPDVTGLFPDSQYLQLVRSAPCGAEASMRSRILGTYIVL